MRYRSYNNVPYFLILIVLFFLVPGFFRLLIGLFFFPLAIILNFFPLFLILGIGYVVAKRISRNRVLGGVIHSRTQDNRRFVELLVHILVAAVQADGRVDERALMTIKAFFRQALQYDESQMSWVEDLMSHALKRSSSLEQCCVQFNQDFNRESKLIALQMVYRVMFADQEFSASEKKFVEKVVHLLGISEFEHARIRNFFVKTDDLEKHYAILGLKRNATQEEIRQAYKKACKENHPDKVHHLGKEFQAIAERKMQEINNSYTVLKGL